MIKNRGVFGLACLITAGLLAACGGGGGGSSVAPSTGITVTPTPAGGTGGTATSSPMQTLSMTVTIPKSITKASTNKRSADYIAANTASLTMTLLSVNGTAVTGASPQGPFNLTTASNPNCVAGSSGTTCTFSFSAPIGTDIFVANTFAGANATGSSLGSGAVLFTVRQNASNAASLALTGPVASVQILSGTTTLSNGNPMVPSGSSSASNARRPGSAHGRHAQGAMRLSSLRVAPATSSRSAQATSGTTVIPATLASRIFVLALDAAGNQIINPTTLDTPITLALHYNGSPAGSLSLGVTYAGLTPADTGTASTSTDGGTISIYAPTDIVNLTISTSVTGSNTDPYAPSVSASFTPNGGSLVNVAPLTYAVNLAPPAPYLIANATHVDPWPAGSTQTETMSIVNGGTQATSGQIEADVYSYGGGSWTFIDNSGSDPSWSCTNYGNEADCVSNAVIPVGGSLPLIFHVMAGSASGTTEMDLYGGNAANTANENYVYVDDNFTVPGGPTPTPGPSASPSLGISLASPNPFYATVPAAVTVGIYNNGGSTTSGTVTLTNTVPSDYTASASGTSWSCGGMSPTVTCTTSLTVAPSATFPPVTLSITAPVAETGYQSQISASVSGGNAPTLSTYIYAMPISPLSFAGTSYPIGVSTGNTFTAGPAAQLTLGAPPVNAETGTVSIMTQSSGSGTYMESDNCSTGVIGPEFSSTFPLTAAGPGTPQPVALNFTPSPIAESCTVSISDSLGNQATLGVAANNVTATIQGTHRTTGVHR
jgi:hypothetical protein